MGPVLRIGHFLNSIEEFVVIVSEHMGWVRNVVLMNVYFGSGKPQGVGISGRGGARWADGEMQGSVYEQPKEEVDGSCHSKEGSKHVERGTRGARGSSCT
jgi:hypothetical protein